MGDVALKLKIRSERGMKGEKSHVHMHDPHDLIPFSKNNFYSYEVSGK